VDAARFATVNKRAAHLVNDDALWRQLFCTTFKFDVPPGAPPQADTGGWRGVYRHHQRTLYRLARRGDGGNGNKFRDAFASGLRGMGAGRVGAVHVYHGGTLVST
jgi:hypothetical protein